MMQPIEKTRLLSFLDMTQIFRNTSDIIYIDSCCHYNKKGNLILINKILSKIEADLEKDRKQLIN